MDFTSIQTVLSVTLTGMLFLWMLVFAFLACRPHGKHKAGEEHQALPSTAALEAQKRTTAPRIAAIQNEAHGFRRENSGEMKAVSA